MNSANLQLSPEELRLVSDPGWILTKNSIVGKAVALLGGLAGEYREVWAAVVAAAAAAAAVAAAAAAGTAAARIGGVAGDVSSGIGVGNNSRAGVGGGVSGIGVGGLRIEPGDPKVSRGENYRGLPWVMLDYPRIFGREDVLAIRTMFLWGHGFNITLHLKGRFQSLYLDVIRERRAALGAAGFFAGVHPDEWRHEHTAEVFRPFSEVDVAELGDGGFLKLSAAVGLDRWAEAPELLVGLFRMLVEVLCAAGEGF